MGVATSQRVQDGRDPGFFPDGSEISPAHGYLRAGAVDRPGSRMRTNVILCGLWTLPGLVYSLQIYQVGLRMDTPSPSYWAAVFHALPVWWFWIPLTPVLVRLARKFPIRSSGAFREIAIHVAISIVITVLVAVLAGIWFSATAPFADRDRPWSTWTMDLMLSTTLHLYFWCYWLIIAAVHFLDHDRRIREQEVNAARLDALAVQSRMQMLANQLQPHFLFNALNGLSTLILRSDMAAAQAMLESLASFLRASLRMGKTGFVPLRDELDLILKYLNVENVRWGGRLRVRTEIEPAVETASIPTLLLQPLIENAIRHGVAASESYGEIFVSAAGDSGRLKIVIENDGAGLDPDWHRRSDDRVGLINTMRRLDLLYGPDHRFDLEEIAGDRVRVEISIPLRHEPAARAEAQSIEGETLAEAGE
ncbi:MAG: hypothetical protein EHM71_15470 [Zetaproteobacteria bacterium]|jgi:two-component sensor histidine kinase|nr:MAG: hypothetical protein EHM71_15470 [Zetaproteobacteria bacterium]